MMIMQLNELKRKQKREEDELTLQKYISGYTDVLNGLDHLHKMAGAGAGVKDILAKVTELLLHDEATWHLYSVEIKAMRKLHAAQRRKLRTRIPGR